MVRLVRRMVSLAMILHDHGSLGRILARSCQDLGKHTHASWQACQDSCHWDGIVTPHPLSSKPSLFSIDYHQWHLGFSFMLIHGIMTFHPLPSMSSLFFIHYYSWHHWWFSSMNIRDIIPLSMVIHGIVTPHPLSFRPSLFFILYHLWHHGYSVHYHLWHHCFLSMIIHGIMTSHPLSSMTSMFSIH